MFHLYLAFRERYVSGSERTMPVLGRKKNTADMETTTGGTHDENRHHVTFSHLCLSAAGGNECRLMRAANHLILLLDVRYRNNCINVM